MKNITSILTFTTTILLLIPAGKYILKVIIPKWQVIKIENTFPEKFDDSLRNFHPNKGE